MSEIEWSGIPIDFALTETNRVRDAWEKDVPELLDFLETVFGPFPFGRLGLSAINGEEFALAAPMRILIPESMPRQVLIHELAHQWAGAAVTSENEASGWLWEGLATYSESLFAEHEGPRCGDQCERPLNERSGGHQTSRPSRFDRGPPRQRDVPAWGAALSRPEVGDRRRGVLMTLREFIQRNLHATAEVEDLQAIAEETSGENLGRFFAAWVTETVVPDLPRTDG